MSKIIIDINNKYFCYFLGLMWADGYIYSDKRSKNRVDICMSYEDLIQIEHIFDAIGDWKKYKRVRKNKNWKDQLNIRAIDENLYEFLKSYDYGSKSNKPPDKIINVIPEELRVYFIKGLFDGDGCFYHKNYTRQCIITSNYDQDWTFIEKILEEIECKSSVVRQIFKSGKKSSIRITNKDIIKFGNYLYKDNELIGIERKYKKFKEIEESYLKNKNRIGNNKKKICVNGIIFDSITEAAIETKISRPSMRYRLSSKKYPEYEYK